MKFRFHKLTPRDDVEIGIYSDALDYVFEQDDLKNIAVTGPFGAGKSSVLESYKKQRSDLTFLHISLARFDEPASSTVGQEPKENGNGNNSNDNSNGNDNGNNGVKGNGKNPIHSLEGKVINQLIHSIDAQKAPKTKFGIKRELSTCRLTLVTMLFVGLTLLPAVVFLFDKWVSYAGEPNNYAPKWLLTPSVPLLAGIVWVLLFIIATFLLVRFFHGKNVFSKISIKGNSIEVFPDEDDSPFDKHLDELLYIVEKSDVDVFVFEDIDRYGCTGIFARLREVNQLVNRRLASTTKKLGILDHLQDEGAASTWDEDVKNIRFFYLIRDDLFSSSERTKFFDFIIPIVPIVGIANAYENLIGMLRESGLENHFEDQFLKEISRYMDDMRVLKNVVNEYTIYLEKLEYADLDHNKLLALIIYKNVYPREFVELQQGRGQVYDLFNSRKEKLINEEIDRLKKQIDELRMQETEVQGGSQEAAFTRNDSVSPSEDDVALETEVSDIEHQVDELLREKRQVHTRKLRDLASNVKDGDDVFKGIQHQPLTVYLIRYGYLDEYYAYYMSYFLGDIGDHVFLRSVTDREPKEFTYELGNPEEVMEGLRLGHFENEEVLNNDLLDYVLQNESSYGPQLRSVLGQLRRERRLDFVSQYLQFGKERTAFVRNLNGSWPQVWSEIFDSEQFSPEQRHLYAVDTLLHSPKTDILELNEYGPFEGYISDNANFLAIDDLDEIKIKRITSNLQKLGVKFNRINLEDSNPSLFSAVYEANLYAITEAMVFLILKEIYAVPESNDYKHRNYSLIVSNRDQPLAKYVNSKMNHYVEWLLGICESRIDDQEEVALEILNHPKVSLENKKQYLVYLETIISKVASVSDSDLWSTMLDEHVAKYSDENVLHYYFNYSESLDEPFDSSLIKFMEANEGTPPKVTYKEIGEKYGSQQRSKWLRDLVKCNDLADSVYELWMQNLHFHYVEFNFEEIDESKIALLLKHRKIQMNSENLEFIREHYEEQVEEYIYLNIDVFIQEVLNEDTFALKETLPLLERDIGDDYKIALLEFAADAISIEGKGYSERVQLHILENNFEETDLPWLIEKFDTMGPSVKDMIVELCEHRVDELISEGYSIPFNLLNVLLDLEIGREEKQALLADSIEQLDLMKTVECLEKVDLGDLVRAFKGGNPRVVKTDDIERILLVLREKGWISDYGSDWSNEEQFRAYGFRKDPPLKE